MLPFAVYAVAASAAGYWNPIPQPGEQGYRSEPQNCLRVLFENDSPSARDCNYTHGTRIDYARTMANGHAWGLSLVQNMYTPETHRSHAVPGEHPYCGYMAVGAGFLHRGERFGWAGEFQVGTTGNPSCAGRFQNTLHDAFRMTTWDGWDDQIPSEVTLQLTLRQEWLLPGLQRTLANGWQVESRAILREAGGTVRMAGGGGVALRVGHNLPPSQATSGNSPASFGLGVLHKPDYKPAEMSYFFALEAYADYVARDISVDGGVFHHFDRTCSRTPWQAELRAGAGARYAGIDYYMGVLVLSRTYRTQDKNSLMGTFSVSWNW